MRAASWWRSLRPHAAFVTRPLRERSTRWSEALPAPEPALPKGEALALPELDIAAVARVFEGSVWAESFNGKLATISASFSDARSAFATFARAVGKTFGGGTATEPWLGFFQSFCRDVGLDFPEAVAFIRRGGDEDGKMARLRALAAAFNLGGLNGCIGLVFSDAAKEEAA